MSPWTAADMPDQTNRIALVTGANSGLGYETVRALARKGAHVLMGCRTLSKGERAREAVLMESPRANIELYELDLASLASVRACAEAVQAAHPHLHMLLNNAGVMAPPRRETVDGFELQFGTNHLGHFALTGLLLDMLLATPDSRVVNTTSVAHHMGRPDWSDPQSRQSYDPWRTYGQSKYANVLFTLELQRKLTATNATTLSIAAHPGYAATNLQASGPGMHKRGFAAQFMSQVGNRLMAQSGASGALPQLYAATAPDAVGGGYYGPDMLGWFGAPTQRKPNPRVFDTAAAAQLWQLSEQLTGVSYGALEQPIAPAAS